MQRTASAILQGDDVLQTWGAVWRAGGEVVATASCQLLPARFANAGVVHMVGALASHAGKGLGGLVTHAVMARFARMGYPAIYLQPINFEAMYQARVQQQLQQGNGAGQPGTLQ